MKINKFIKLIFYTIFIIFIFSYAITNSGYYEYSLYNKKTLTSKKIKEFENDVNKGKEIDINDYLNNNYTDYSNKLTRTTTNISLKLNNYLKDLLTSSFHLIEKLVK